jgi:hypothetical protein
MKLQEEMAAVEGVIRFLDPIPFLRQWQQGAHNISRGCTSVSGSVNEFITNSKNTAFGFLD